MAAAAADPTGRFERTLAPVEEAARSLPWARERAWRCRTHLRSEHGVVVVDLHDLDVRLGRTAARLAAETTAREGLGAVILVTGRGRHNLFGRAPLRDAVGSELRREARSRGGEVRPGGPGRWVLVLDPARAPAHAAGRMGWGCRLGMVAFAAAVVLALWLSFTGR